MRLPPAAGAVVWVAVGWIAACASAGELLSDLAFGPLDVGLRVLKLDRKDLRVKPEYVEDQVGGGALRLRFVTDGLRGMLNGASAAGDLGRRLTEDADLARQVELLTGLLDEGQAASPPPPAPASAAEPIPGAPPALRQAVTELVYAAAHADALLARMTVGLPEADAACLRATLPGALLEQRMHAEVVQALRIAAQLDLREVVSATAVVTDAAGRARELLAEAQADEAFMVSPQAAEATLWAVDAPFGPVVVAGTGDNVHTTPAAILIDLGGRDRYELAGGGLRVQVVIDLAGDDTYAPAGSFGPSAAILGVSLLVDEAGDDTYVARGPAAFGAGVCGSGLLFDAAGNDRYIGVTFGQGAGMLGLGLLCDAEGDDVYEADLYAQGFGSVKGVGALLDHAGQDRYQAGQTYAIQGAAGARVLACAQGFGLGLRGAGAPGGLGLLVDAGGSDTYVADTYSQGAGWWYGAGVLLDRAGDDQYQGGEYSQGAGGFLALGYLLDDEGRDRYGATERAQGFGLERGLGLLWDASGDDSYAADRLAQGAALTGGIGLAVDLTGDDAYLPGESSLGSVPEGDTSHAVALFVDGAGEDSHAGRDRDDLCWSGGPTGIGVDTEAGDLTRLRTSLPMGTGRLPFSSRQTLGPTDLRPVPGDLPPSTDLDQLWGQAAQSEDFRRRRDAVLAFSRLGEQAVPFLIAKLGEVDETQVKLAQEVLAQVGSPAVPELLRLMDEGTDREAAIAMGALARTDDQRAGTYLTRQAKSPQWRTRAAAAGAMGGQGGEDTRLALEQLLRDTDEDVRRAAVVALRRRGATDSAEAISNLLGDPVFAVRFAAADALVALVALGGRCPPHVFSLVGSGQPDIRYLSLETCGRLGSRQSLPMLISQLQSRDWTDRAFAAEAICRLGDPSACSALQGLLEAESNGIVLGKARAALKATRLCDGQP